MVNNMMNTKPKNDYIETENISLNIHAVNYEFMYFIKVQWFTYCIIFTVSGEM